MAQALGGSALATIAEQLGAMIKERKGVQEKFMAQLTEAQLRVKEVRLFFSTASTVGWRSGGVFHRTNYDKVLCFPPVRNSIALHATPILLNNTMV